MIKALTGTLYATPEVSPRSSPTFGQLDAERSGRVNVIEGVPEAPTVTDARGKVELELRSPIVSFEGELRQERRLTLTEGLEQFQGVPRPFSEEKQNSEMSVLSHSRQSPAIVHGGERDAGGEYSQPFSALSNFHGGDRGLDRGSSTIPSPPFNPQLDDHLPGRRDSTIRKVQFIILLLCLTNRCTKDSMRTFLLGLGERMEEMLLNVTPSVQKSVRGIRPTRRASPWVPPWERAGQLTRTLLPSQGMVGIACSKMVRMKLRDPRVLLCRVGKMVIPRCHR